MRYVHVYLALKLNLKMEKKNGCSSKKGHREKRFIQVTCNEVQNKYKLQLRGKFSLVVLTYRGE